MSYERRSLPFSLLQRCFPTPALTCRLTCSKPCPMIRRNVQIEAHFIDELLDLTRISQGNLRCERRVVDLHEVERSAVKVCEADIATGSNCLKLSWMKENPE